MLGAASEDLHSCRSVRDRHPETVCIARVAAMNEAGRSAQIREDMKEQEEEGPDYCRTITQEIREIGRKWRVLPTQDLEHAYRVRASNAWMQYTRGKKLREVKTTMSPAFYILHETKPQVCLRARLRQDVANNAVSLNRRGLLETTQCQRCGYYEDDREHLLLYCPRFADLRETAIRELRALSPPTELTLQLLLADESIYPNGKVTKRRTMMLCRSLEITGQFLLDIHRRSPRSTHG